MVISPSVGHYGNGVDYINGPIGEKGNGLFDGCIYGSGVVVVVAVVAVVAVVVAVVGRPGFDGRRYAPVTDERHERFAALKRNFSSCE